MSKLNCKPGDLAIIIGARSKVGKLNIGRIVRVLEPAKPGRYHGANHVIPACGKWWFVEAVGADLIAPLEFFGSARVRIASALDDHLRPIRDQPGEDETLAWTGKPAHEHQERARELLGVFEGVQA